MKNPNPRSANPTVSFLILSLVGAQFMAGAQVVGTNSPPEDAPAAAGQLAAGPLPSGLSAPETNSAAAPLTDPPNGMVAPPHVRRSGPVADVIKLVNSGVDQAVILAFVSNSASFFSPSAEEIIYLHDLGVAGAVATAMLEHDRALKQVPANTTAEPPPLTPEQPGPADSFGGAPMPPAVADPGPETGGGPEEMFYDSLAPYGTWVDIDGYGQCWQPAVVVVNPDWQPYFDGGSWVYSDSGWYWSSTYSWGWAPFHYGRWFRHGRWGWCWVPDRVWAPSWVCWRYTEGHCGWAPLPPGASWKSGVGLVYRGHHVERSFTFGLGVNAFVFVPWGHFQDHHLRPFALPTEQAGRVFRQSAPSTQFTGNGREISNNGLSAAHVAAATHTTVHAVALRDVNSPIGAGGRVDRRIADHSALDVYRPVPGSDPGMKNSRQPRFEGPGTSSGRVPTRPEEPASVPRQPTIQPENRIPAYQPPPQTPRYEPAPVQRPHAEYSAPPSAPPRPVAPPSEPRPAPPPPPPSSGGQPRPDKGGR